MDFVSPWNSPGQNSGVGSLSLLQKDLPDPGINPGSPSFQADSLPTEPPGKPKNPGVGSLSLLQGIFPTQGSNTGLPHCCSERWGACILSNSCIVIVKVKLTQSHLTLYPMDCTLHGVFQAKIVEWVGYPFSSGSSRPRNQPGVSCISGRFYTR